ncbi:MAG: SH3 domain-containing protein, partial [Elusimicrobiaceae bacterium]|nr:SH3 domain-containing protein [Elusimicrobiaceae bacterium]
PVAEIRSGPGTNFPASASAAQGHLVTISDGKDAWYEVVVASQGIKGWIEKNALEKI